MKLLTLIRRSKPTEKCPVCGKCSPESGMCGACSASYRFFRDRLIRYERVLRKIGRDRCTLEHLTGYFGLNCAERRLKDPSHTLCMACLARQALEESNHAP
jgi:hypothetical protein